MSGVPDSVAAHNVEAHAQARRHEAERARRAAGEPRHRREAPPAPPVPAAVEAHNAQAYAQAARHEAERARREASGELPRSRPRSGRAFLDIFRRTP